jgi:hypothetical protein
MVKEEKACGARRLFRVRLVGKIVCKNNYYMVFGGEVAAQS